MYTMGQSNANKILEVVSPHSHGNNIKLFSFGGISHGVVSVILRKRFACFTKRLTTHEFIKSFMFHFAARFLSIIQFGKLLGFLVLLILFLCLN